MEGTLENIQEKILKVFKKFKKVLKKFISKKLLRNNHSCYFWHI